MVGLATGFKHLDSNPTPDLISNEFYLSLNIIAFIDHLPYYVYYMPKDWQITIYKKISNSPTIYYPIDDKPDNPFNIIL